MGAVESTEVSLRQALADADRDTVEPRGGCNAAIKKILHLHPSRAERRARRGQRGRRRNA